MSTERALVDTNVLVYAHFQDSDHHDASKALLDQAQDGQLELCINPQILSEFFSIVTNPRRVSNPFSTEEALNALDAVVVMPGLTLLPFPPDLHTRWMDLARQHSLTGADVFDAQLAATMQSHGLTRIYTFNTSDFSRYSGLDVTTP